MPYHNTMAGTKLDRERNISMYEPRLRYAQIAPKAREAVMTVEAYVQACELDAALIELVKVRASQINRCVYCVDLHTKAARRLGESQQRLDLLLAWQEGPAYTERERAALAWTEALTRLSVDGAPEDAFNNLKAHFTDKEIVDLTVLVGHINLLNRLGVGFRLQPPMTTNRGAALPDA